MNLHQPHLTYCNRPFQRVDPGIPLYHIYHPFRGHIKWMQATRRMLDVSEGDAFKPADEAAGYNIIDAFEL